MKGTMFDLQDGTGRFAIAVHQEQEPAFKGKLCLRLYNDAEFQQPILNDNGEPRRVLKDPTKLKFIGYVD